MPKIVVVAGQFPARSETFIREHVMGLANRGYCVLVVSCGRGQDIQTNEVEEIDLAGVQRIDIPCFCTDQWRNFRRLFRVTVRYPKMTQYFSQLSFWTRREMFWAHEVCQAIEQAQPDLVHIHMGSKAGPLVRYGLPKPTVVSWHGYDANCVPKSRGDGLY